MESPTKELIKEIQAMEDISLRKLALEVDLKPSTLSRIMSGKTKTGMTNTYLKISQYKTKILRQISESLGGATCYF